MKKWLVGLTMALGITQAAVADPDFTLNKDVLVIEGPIYRQVQRLANQLLMIKHEKPGTIDIVINSPGGSVYAGWQFVNAMRTVQARGYKLRCTVTTMAASMAYQILAECDERYAFRYSTLLWHPVRLSGNLTLTPKEALGITRQLSRIERLLVSDLRSKFEIEDKEFWLHYHAETLHVATQVADMSPDFVTIITDVAGINSLSGLSVGTDTDGVGPIVPANSISNPNLDIYIYMHPVALELWETTHGKTNADAGSACPSTKQ